MSRPDLVSSAPGQRAQRSPPTSWKCTLPTPLLLLLVVPTSTSTSVSAKRHIHALPHLAEAETEIATPIERIQRPTPGTTKPAPRSARRITFPLAQRRAHQDRTTHLARTTHRQHSPRAPRAHAPPVLALTLKTLIPDRRCEIHPTRPKRLRPLLKPRVPATPYVPGDHRRSPSRLAPLGAALST